MQVALRMHVHLLKKSLVLKVPMPHSLGWMLLGRVLASLESRRGACQVFAIAEC